MNRALHGVGEKERRIKHSAPRYQICIFGAAQALLKDGRPTETGKTDDKGEEMEGRLFGLYKTPKNKTPDPKTCWETFFNSRMFQYATALTVWARQGHVELETRSLVLHILAINNLMHSYMRIKLLLVFEFILMLMEKSASIESQVKKATSVDIKRSSPFCFDIVQVTFGHIWTTDRIDLISTKWLLLHVCLHIDLCSP